MDPGAWAQQPKASMSLERSVSFLKMPGAEQYPAGPLLAFLIVIMITVGADDALFPNISKALERTVEFDMSNFANLQTIQGFTQAVLGPIWGVMCARGYVERKTILAVLTFAQGLATLVMTFYINDLWLMRFLRFLNGACLSGMMPIAFSIIADRFDDEVRGRMCALMNMCRYGVGGSVFGYVYGIVGEWCPSEGRWEPCETTGCTSSCSCASGLVGWQYSLIITGVVIMAFAPSIYVLMKPPPIIVKDVANPDENVLLSELKALGRLLGSTPTFLVLVIQGCFGAIPGNAMQMRSFFFQTAGLGVAQATTVGTVAGLVGIFGTGFSGWLSDTLVRIWPLHGRVMNAEFSVYIGIPLCFLTFSSAFAPSAEFAFVYFMSLAVLLSLVMGGVAGGTNIPILSQLAEPEDRALIISWQSAMEGAVSTFGPVMFANIAVLLGYNQDCNDEVCNPQPGCNYDLNADAAGTALLYTTCGPWLICGVLYSSLHYLYPRDMERIFEERRQKQEGAGAGLSTELTTV